MLKMKLNVTRFCATTMQQKNLKPIVSKDTCFCVTCAIAH